MVLERNKNGHQRRLLRQRVLRSHSVCSWCGQPVDKSLPALDPMAPQVDHTVAVENGGAEFDIRNATLMHRKCNREKWHRDIPTDLGTSQDWWPA